MLDPSEAREGPIDTDRHFPSESRLRLEAALALAKSGATSAAGALGSALDRLSSEVGPEAEQLRISIVEALAGLATPAARQVLQRHAERSLSPVERTFTQRALGAQQ